MWTAPTRTTCSDYEITFTVGKKQLGPIIDRTISKHGFTVAAEVLDKVKATGYKYSTKCAMTISVADMTVPPQKQVLLKETEERTLAIEEQYKMGFMTDEERYKAVVAEWEKTTDDVSNACRKTWTASTPSS